MATKAKIALASLGFIFCIGGLAFSDATPMRRYKSQTDHYSVSFIADWHVGSKWGDISMFAIGPELSKNFKVSFNIVVEEFGKNSEEIYFKNNLKNMQLRLENFRLITQSDLQIQGRPCQFVEYESSLKGVTMRNYSWVIFAKDKAFVLTGTTLPESAKNSKQDFEKIINSFSPI